MELKQKKNQEENWTEKEIEEYDKIIKSSNLPLFKLINDYNTQNFEYLENFFIFVIEKSDYAKSLEKNGNPKQKIHSQLSNYEMKTRSIYKQPIRIQLLVNAIIKGSVGDKKVNKQYAFSQLFNAIKNNHLMKFVGEGFFDMYYISIYKCAVSDKILDHLLNKTVYVCKDSESVLIFKNESLTLKQDSFQDFFLPQEENFKYYSVSDYLKKSTFKLYTKALWFLNNHDNNNVSKSRQKDIEKYETIFFDLNEGITPDLQEKKEYDERCKQYPHYKQEICHYYQTNSCINKMNSIKCKFAHGEIELRQEINESEGSQCKSNKSLSSQINNINEPEQEENSQNSDINSYKEKSKSNIYKEDNHFYSSNSDEQNNHENKTKSSNKNQNNTDSDSFFNYNSSDDENTQNGKQQQQNNENSKQNKNNNENDDNENNKKSEYDLSMFCKA